MIVLVGPDAPDWLYANNVPKVIPAANSKTQGSFDKYPYYPDAAYKMHLFRMIGAVSDHLNVLPVKLSSGVSFVQVATGCTGHEVGASLGGTLFGGSLAGGASLEGA